MARIVWQYQELAWVPPALTPASVFDAVFYQQQVPLAAYKYNKTHFIHPYVEIISWAAIEAVGSFIKPYGLCVEYIPQHPYAHLVGFDMPVARLIRAYDNRAAEPLPCRCLLDECGST